MKLYRFRSLDFADKNILEYRKQEIEGNIHFSTLQELNDPYEDRVKFYFAHNVNYLTQELYSFCNYVNDVYKHIKNDYDNIAGITNLQWKQIIKKYPFKHTKIQTELLLKIREELEKSYYENKPLFKINKNTIVMIPSSAALKIIVSCIGNNDKEKEHCISKLFYTFFNRNILGEFKVASFSSIWNSPLMWIHYASGGKGICIEYDIPSIEDIDFTIIKKLAMRNNKSMLFVLSKIQYVSYFSSYNYYNNLSSINNINTVELFEYMANVYNQKMLEASYEKEYRLSYMLEPNQDENDVHNININDCNIKITRLF